MQHDHAYTLSVWVLGRDLLSQARPTCLMLDPTTPKFTRFCPDKTGECCWTQSRESRKNQPSSPWLVTPCAPLFSSVPEKAHHCSRELAILLVMLGSLNLSCNLIVVEVSSHTEKRFLFNHTTLFSTKCLQKSLYDFTGTTFSARVNPYIRLFLWSGLLF